MTPQTRRRILTALWTLASLAVLLSLYLAASFAFRRHTAEREREAIRVVAEFHQHYNAQDFEAICRSATKCSELDNVREGWRQVVQDTRDRGGAFKGIIRSDVHVYVEPPSVQADVVSSFEKGELREIFVMNDFDGQLKMTTYNLVFNP